MSTELHLPNLTNTPPNGWRYQIPETGKWVKGNNIGAVVAAAHNQYTANDLPAPLNLETLVERQICQAYPDYCQPHQPGLARHSSGFKRTLAMVISGTRTLGSWMISGMPLVAPELAEKRADVCVGCPNNVEPSGCTGCNLATLRAVIEAVVGGRKTKHDAQLKACQVCGCSLKAKVVIPGDILVKNMPRDVFELLPAHCWLVSEQVKE